MTYNGFLLSSLRLTDKFPDLFIYGDQQNNIAIPQRIIIHQSIIVVYEIWLDI